MPETIPCCAIGKTSEARQRRLLNMLSQLVWLVRPDGCIDFASDRAAEYFGFDVQGMRPDAWLAWVHADDRAAVPTTWPQTLAAQQTWQHEARLLRPGDSTGRWHLLHAQADLDGENRLVQWLITATDVDDRRQGQEALRASQEQLRQAQKMEALGRLAGGVAHDFNNLLTAIVGYADMLVQSLPPGSVDGDAAVEIHRAGERAAGLTRQLLAFSRRQVVAPRRIDLNAVVKDVERMLRRLIGADVTLRVALDPHGCAIHADSGQIEQVILNLALNARDAMPRGGLLTIETRVVVLDTAQAAEMGLQAGPHVRLTFVDTGVGMSAETQGHLFEPFFTTKPRGHGTGQGLATAYGILAQCGAHIAVHSQSGRGSTFLIHFPCDSMLELPVTIDAGGRKMPGGHETVLLVEDESSVRRLVRIILDTLGYRVIEASSGAQALQVAATEPEVIDILVTDVVMPGMGGRELAVQLTKVRPNLRVLYMSGYTDDTVLRHGVLEAEVAFVAKPFNAESLALTLRETLDRQPIPG